MQDGSYEATFTVAWAIMWVGGFILVTAAAVWLLGKIGGKRG
jgi:hypothetical protein